MVGRELSTPSAVNKGLSQKSCVDLNPISQRGTYEENDLIEEPRADVKCLKY